MMYAILTERDYADEFDYPITSICTKQELDSAVTKVNKLKTFKEKPSPYDRYQSYMFCFGTNECFEFSKQNLMDLLDEAAPISDEELAVLTKFRIGTIGLDIVSAINNENFLRNGQR